MKIQNQQNGKLADSDMLQLVTLLAKARYAVQLRQRKKPGKTTNEHYIEFWGNGDEQQIPQPKDGV